MWPYNKNKNTSLLDLRWCIATVSQVASSGRSDDLLLSTDWLTSRESRLGTFRIAPRRRPLKGCAEVPLSCWGMIPHGGHRWLAWPLFETTCVPCPALRHPVIKWVLGKFQVGIHSWVIDPWWTKTSLLIHALVQRLFGFPHIDFIAIRVITLIWWHRQYYSVCGEVVCP